MRPILSPEGMRELEQKAFSRGVSPLLLMEDAARAMAERLFALEKDAKSCAVLCGSGNNGGDGLALARLLLKRGVRAAVFLPKESQTPQALENLRYFEALGGEIRRDIPDEWPFDFAVDALFGTGFRGRVRPPYDAWVQALNASGLRVYAVDIPSGLDGETGACGRTEDGLPLCVRADKTFVLGYPKEGLLLGPDRALCGKLIDCPIHLPADEPPTDTYLMEREDLMLLPVRAADAHKGLAGRVLIYAGSKGMAGAAAMAALGALRMGAGLVTVACEEEVLPIVQTLVPNAMCVPISQAVKAPPPHDALAAGCGLGQTEETREKLVALLSLEAGPAVLDADALNLFAQKPFALPRDTLLTPHIGEAARLLGQGTDGVLGDMKGSAAKLSESTGACVLLKSAASVATDGKEFFVNALSAPALAKGGSGDALCGMTAALLAEQRALHQSRPLHPTAALSSLIMSLCGREADRRIGPRSALTGEVLEQLRAVLNG